MRIIDFLQLISDLDKQTQFFYSDADKNLWAITGVLAESDCVYLATKKTKQHALHQWELVTLLNPLKPKTNFIKIKVEADSANIFGLQIHPREVYVN